MESAENLKEFLENVPDRINIVPKIESVEGVVNIKPITDALGTNKIIMLDHDDLHSSIIKANQPISKFLECFNALTEYCKSNNVILLRTIGVVFSDQEKKVSDYIG